MEAGVTGLGRNAIWRYAALGASSIEGLVVAGVALRRLGADGYGAFALAATTIGLLGTIDFGLSFSVIRSIARDHPRFGEEDRAQARKDVSAAHATYAGCGLATLVATGLIVWLLPFLTTSDRISESQDRLTILLVGISIAIFLATAVFDGIPAGRSRFGVTAISAATGAAANIAFVVLAIDHLHLVALGAGQLLGTVVQRFVGGAWISRRESWFRLFPARARRADLRKIAIFTLPLLVLSVGGQLIATTDLVVIGAISTATAVALYRVGSLAPNQLVTVIYTGFDATFPSLSANSSRETQEVDIAFLTRFACYASGVAFGAIVMLRSDVVALIVGRSNHLATTVLIIFAVVWVANVPVHGLALLLIARARQKTFIPLVATEAVANIGLTIVFVYTFGAVGAAVATLVTIVISNDLVFPLLVRKEFGLSPMRVLWGNGVPAVVVGATVSIVAVLPFYVLRPGIVRLSLGVVVAALLGLVLGFFLLGGSGRGEAPPHVAADGRRKHARVDPSYGKAADMKAPRNRTLRFLGLKALEAKRRAHGARHPMAFVAEAGRQRLERIDDRQRLSDLRSGRHGPWPPVEDENPLVTIRIATYNRGQLVADRAIASAVAQTYPNLEILVVGDHCDAATEMAVKSVDDPRIKFINLAERGRYPADPTLRWMVAGTTPMNAALAVARRKLDRAVR